MTSSHYLKFLAVTNILSFGLLCTLCYLFLNGQPSEGLVLLIVIGLALVSGIQLFYPRKFGIQPYKQKNKSLMKQSILYWVKDERELMAALKTYSQGYFYSANAAYLLLAIIFVMAVLRFNPLAILNIVLALMFLNMAFLNIMFVIDWYRFAEEE